MADLLALSELLFEMLSLVDVLASLSLKLVDAYSLVEVLAL